MKTWLVETHLGTFETTAESAEKAISNIRYRLFGRRPDRGLTTYWKAMEK